MAKQKHLLDVKTKQRTQRIAALTKKKSTKEEIQQRLRAVGAKVSGSKPVLEKRLQLWEEHNLGRQLVETVIVAKTKIDFPPTENFSPLKSLKKSNIQAVTLTVIDDWFDVRQANTSKENGRVLCLTKFVKSVLVLKEGDLILVKGRCAAETKKSTEYILKMVSSTHVLEPGIFQAQCQCTAGDGYSVACKHVAAIAYCVEHYARSGDSLELIPCTSTLQSWHRPPAPGRNFMADSKNYR